MGKKHKQAAQNRQESSSLPPEGEGLSRRGKKVIAVGVGTLVLGFIVLSRADPMGRNWAATVSPFLILGAYVVIGLGIFVPDPSSSVPPSGPEKTT